MRVLIVGCGYIGLALGAELARRGHTVFGLRRSGAAGPALEAAGIRPLVGDITDARQLSVLPADYDWVADCVSASGGGVEEYRGVYLEGARNLVEWLGARPPKSFVYTSSTGVYGQTDGALVDEGSPTVPEAATAQVLVETERVFLEAAQRRRFPAVILRLAGIYGPGRGYWLQQFLRGKARPEARIPGPTTSPVEPAGSGGRFLNMVHRDDVVGAILAAFDRGRPGEIYNVVDNEPVSQQALFEWMSARLGRPTPPAASAPALEGKRGQTNKRVSNRKLRLELGYDPQYPTFREGFEREIGV